jgi:N12 class adenine-specific DNA methylase
VLATGRAFENPETGMLEMRERYLSGNVREKLAAARDAAEQDKKYKPNVEALEKVQPTDVPLGDIHYQLSSRWIPDEVLSKFATDEFGTPTTIHYVQQANRYAISAENKNAPAITTTYGTPDLDALDLIKHALNGNEPTVHRWVGSGRDRKQVIDEDATTAARQQLRKLKDVFVSWSKTTESTVNLSGEDLPVQTAMERRYNELNNSTVPPVYEGGHLVLPGLSKAVKLRPHQLGGVARVLQDGFAVLAHGVGSGKTYLQIVAAMERRRLGLSKKPMIVVQKATIGQFAASFMRSYPRARVLVADAKSFAAKNRQRLMARIATGDWDAVVVTQPQFDRLADDPKALVAYFNEQLDELETALRAARAAAGDDKRDPTVKELEAAKARLEAKLQKATDALAERADTTLFFQQLGVDSLTIDEAHAYKKIPIVTQRTRVKGIPSGNSQRAVGLQIKAKHVQDRNGGKGVVLATGTPVTNSMAEAYVMLQLAAPHVLRKWGIRNFDEWANTFGELQSKVEYSWSGKFKLVDRFNKFVNGPELVTLIRSVFDVKIGNKKLGIKVPELKGGKPEIVVVKQTPPMKQISQFLLDVADAFEHTADKRPVSWVPIVTMQAGMAAALDPRLFDPSLPDAKDSKVNTAIRRILEIYKRKPGKTQLVFADRFKPLNTDLLQRFAGGGPVDVHIADTPELDEAKDEAPLSDDAEDAPDDVEDAEAKARSEQEDADYKSGGFNLYHDIRDKLIAAGVPAKEIAIVHDYNTDQRREQLFADMNAGTIRILIGSTEKTGVGVNVQTLLYAMHHLDPPRSMTPAMMEQRKGRMIRQGNENEEVEELQYGTEKSMDTGIYQMLEDKGRFIAQVLSGEGVGREFEDAADELVLGMAEMKAMLTGDPRVLQKVELDGKVKRLQQERSGFESNKAREIQKLDQTRRRIDNLTKNIIPSAQADAKTLHEKLDDKDAWTLDTGKQTFTGGKDIAPALEELIQKLGKNETYELKFNGLPLRLTHNFETFLGRVMEGYSYALLSPDLIRMAGGDVNSGQGMVMSMGGIPGRADRTVTDLQKDMADAKAQIPALEKAVKEKWPRQAELDDLQTKLNALDADLLGKTPAATVEAPTVGDEAREPEEIAASLAVASQAAQAAEATGRRDSIDPLLSLLARRGRQRGFINLAPVAHYPAGLLQGGKKLLDWWSKPLVEAVEDKGGTVGKDIADSFRRGFDFARKVHGELAAQLHDTLVHVAGRSRISRRAVRELHQDVPGPATSPVRYAISTFRLAVEGGYPLAKLAPAARKAVENHRKLMMASGAIAVREKWQAWDSKTSAWVPFVPATDGKRLVRTPTPEFWDILAQGSHTQAFQDVVAAFTDANSLPKPVVLQELESWGDGPLFKRNAAEERRVLKVVPSAIWTGGRRIQLFVDDPFEAATRLVRNFSLRAGYIHAIGQDTPIPKSGKQTVSDILVDRYKKAGGDPELLKDLMRTANGIPLDVVRFASPGTALYDAFRAARAGLSLFRSGVLTMAFIPNLFEPFAKTQAMVGFGDFLRAYAVIALHPQMARQATARLGARTQDVFDWTPKEGHALEYVARIAGLLTKPMQEVNELNELHAAVVGTIKMDKLKAGQGTPRDRAMLQQLNFTPAQVHRLMKGIASPDEYQAVATRMAERTQGSTSFPGEKSRASNSRIFRELVSFDSYPEMTANRSLRYVRKLFEAYRSGNRKDAWNQMRVLAAYILGVGVAGSAAALLYAYLGGGNRGLVIKASEALDDPIDFLKDAFTYNLLGGVSAAMYRMGFENQDRRWIAPMLDITLPVSVIQEIYDFAHGYGQYKDRSTMEKAGQLFKSRVPMTRALATVAAATGMADDDGGFEQATRAFYRWRRDHPSDKGHDVGGTYVSEGDALEFRIHMRRAHEQMNQGNDERATDELAKALEIKADEVYDPNNAVAASIRGRKLLKGLSEDELEALQKHIGRDAYDRLVDHDMILEGWANAVDAPIKKHRRR